MTALLNSLFGSLSPLWETSLTAAYVTAVVVLLRLVLKKRAPRQVLCVLWLVVFARLLIPVSLESPLSILPDPEQVQQVQEFPAKLVGGGQTAPVQNPAQGQGGATANPVSQGNVEPDATPLFPTLSQPEGANPSQPQAPKTFPWQALVAGVWLAGALAMCLYALFSYLSLKSRLFDAIRAEDGAWEHPSVGSPFILGILRPRVYLPAGLWGMPRQFILCHERAHLRRLDHIVKPICWVALALHWFNPAVWAAFILMSRDIEAACDEAVIRQLGPRVKADYSATLLSLATNGRVPAPCPLAFDEGDAKGRIQNVLRYRRPALWIVVVSVVMAFMAAVCLLTDPVSAKEPDPGPSQSQGQEQGLNHLLDPWMLEVLNGDKTFTSPDSGTAFGIKELKSFYYGDYADEYPDVVVDRVKLAIIDLDKDGIHEMVVWPEGEDEYLYSVVGYLILHREGDVVYGHNLGYRAFGLLKDDGTYHWSSSAAEHGTGSLSFEDGRIVQRNITWCKPADEPDVLHYFVNGLQATSEEFDAANTAQEAKSEPTWYVFEDGVLKLLSNAASINVPIPLDDAALSVAVPDFLNEEQQAVYRQAYAMYIHAFGINSENVDDWPGYTGFNYDYQDPSYIDGTATYVPATGLYANWDDFYEAVLSVFTQDFWNEKNGTDTPTYIDRAGILFYRPAARGGGGYNENFPETFRLVEQTDDTVSFIMTGYYSDDRQFMDTATDEQRAAWLAAGWENSIEYSMRMVRTENGWRFDEFHCARTDNGLLQFSSQAVPNPNPPAPPGSAAPEPTPSASAEPSSSVCAHGLEDVRTEYMGNQLVVTCNQCGHTYTVPGVTSANWDGITGQGDGGGWLREDLEGDGRMEVTVFSTDGKLIVLDVENGRLLTSTFNVWQLVEDFNQNRTYEFGNITSDPDRMFTDRPTTVTVSYQGKTAQSAISENQQQEMINRAGGFSPMIWASDCWVTFPGGSFLYGFPLHADRGYDYDITAHWTIAYSPSAGLQVSSFSM